MQAHLQLPKKKVIQMCNDIGVSIWSHFFSFWANYSSNYYATTTQILPHHYVFILEVRGFFLHNQHFPEEEKRYINFPVPAAAVVWTSTFVIQHQWWGIFPFRNLAWQQTSRAEGKPLTGSQVMSNGGLWIIRAHM